MTTLNWQLNQRRGYHYKALIGDKPPKGAVLTRKEFIIRSCSAYLVLDSTNNYEKFKSFHHDSGGAIIGICSDPEDRRCYFQYLDLLGSVDQVDAAEKLIRAFIRERYADNPCPPLLMEPGLYHTSIPLSEEKICGLMRSYDNQVIMEAQTGTWLEIELDDVTSNPTGIIIYGNYESQVHKAVDLVTKIISAFQLQFELQYEPIPKEAIWFLCKEYPASKNHDRGEAEERPLPSKKQRIMNLGVGNETMDMECVVVN